MKFRFRNQKSRFLALVMGILLVVTSALGPWVLEAGAAGETVEIGTITSNENGVSFNATFTPDSTQTLDGNPTMDYTITKKDSRESAATGSLDVSSATTTGSAITGTLTNLNTLKYGEYTAEVTANFKYTGLSADSKTNSKDFTVLPKLTLIAKFVDGLGNNVPDAIPVVKTTDALYNNLHYQLTIGGVDGVKDLKNLKYIGKYDTKIDNNDTSYTSLSSLTPKEKVLDSEYRIGKHTIYFLVRAEYGDKPVSAEASLTYEIQSDKNYISSVKWDGKTGTSVTDVSVQQGDDLTFSGELGSDYTNQYLWYKVGNDTGAAWLSIPSASINTTDKTFGPVTINTKDVMRSTPVYVKATAANSGTDPALDQETLYVTVTAKNAPTNIQIAAGSDKFPSATAGGSVSIDSDGKQVMKATSIDTKFTISGKINGYNGSTVYAIFERNGRQVRYSATVDNNGEYNIIVTPNTKTTENTNLFNGTYELKTITVSDIPIIGWTPKELVIDIDGNGLDKSKPEIYNTKVTSASANITPGSLMTISTNIRTKFGADGEEITIRKVAAGFEYNEDGELIEYELKQNSNSNNWYTGITAPAAGEYDLLIYVEYMIGDVTDDIWGLTFPEATTFTVKGSGSSNTRIDNLSIAGLTNQDLTQLRTNDVISVTARIYNYTGIERVVAVFAGTNNARDINVELRNSTGAPDYYYGTFTVANQTTRARYTFNHAKLYNSQGREIGTTTSSFGGITFTVVDGSTDPNHTHTYSSAWTTDSTSHWHAATCEHTSLTSGLGAHTFPANYTVSTQPTATTTGMQYRDCTICGYRQTSVIPATGSGSAGSLANTVVSSLNNSSITQVRTAYLSTDTTLSAGVFDALKRNPAKSIQLYPAQGSGVTWTFYGADITGTSKNINLNVDIASLSGTASANKNMITNLVVGRPTVVLSFANNGVLPGRALVRIPLTETMIQGIGRSGISAFYVNAVSNTLDPITTNLAVAASPNNYVEFYITHNSDIVLVGNNVGLDPNTTVPTGNGTTVNPGGGGSATTLDPNAGISGGSGTGGAAGTTGNRVVTTYQTVNRVVSPKTSDPIIRILFTAMMLTGILMIIVAVFVKPEENKKRRI